MAGMPKSPWIGQGGGNGEVGGPAIPASPYCIFAVSLKSSNAGANGCDDVLIASRPTFSFGGQTVSIGLSFDHFDPSYETAPEIRLPFRSMRR
jgi:hypothetical protein